MARINYFEQDQLQLSTCVSGTLSTPETQDWLTAFARYGWFTLAVLLKIHWQAVKLLLKGATFHTKPPPPNNSVTETR
ncbi:MAG: DUF1365 domain-containing protein [Limnobacter sp.]|nr:DUF1365 domain-containing protein [Limnobacter sp.]